MGLFSSKKVYVSSVVYNMAGDIAQRMDYLKSTVASSVINNSRFSMSETLTGSYLNGPGIKIRSFHRWAKRPLKYHKVGVPTVNIYSPSWNATTVKNNIPVGSGQTAVLRRVEFGAADPSYWAEQWVMENYQIYFGSQWVGDYDNLTGQITITWEAGNSPSGLVTSVFTPPAIDFGARYYYATYELFSSNTFIGARMWIYKYGAGNAAMDAMPIQNTLIDEFVPFIPIRIKNEFISETYKPDVWAQTKKAYKKAFPGAKIQDLINQIADNDDLDQIDHAYVVFGVSLNTQDNKSRRYLFKFFDFLRTAQITTTSSYSSYSSQYDDYLDTYVNGYQARRLYLDNEINGGGEPEDPIYGGNIQAAPPLKPLNKIEIESSGDYDAKLHMIMSWADISKTTHTGLGKPGAKVGDLWWDTPELLEGDSEWINFINEIISSKSDGGAVTLNWQTSANTYEKLRIVNLQHENRIYKSKSVDISAGEALADPDESGFVVPIHYETMRSMSLVDSTQMVLSSSYVVFNCYKVVKKKWYQTGIFKIVMFVALVAITVATGGAGAIGLLGTAGQVGAALGFSGLMGAIVGAVVNAIAAMVLMSIISKVSVALFGAQIGAIIGAVAGAVGMAVGGGLMSGQSMSSIWSSLSSATGILGMTNSVAGGIGQYVQGAAQAWAGKEQQLMAEYQKASQTIQQKYLDEFGYGRFVFDPTMFTDVGELPTSFLERTLMTGSDVASMSLDMLTNFTDLTLDVNTIGS